MVGAGAKLRNAPQAKVPMGELLREMGRMDVLRVTARAAMPV